MNDPYVFKEDLTGYIDLVIPTAKRSGAFYIRYAQKVTVNDVDIENCYLAD